MLKIRVMGYDHRHFDIQLPGTVAVKQIVKTVIIFRHQNSHSGPVFRLSQIPFHTKFSRSRSELGIKFLRRKTIFNRLKLNTDKKAFRDPVIE